jgi:hypothetical protein
MALVSDPSLAGFNSFSSVAAADAYHATRLHNTSWTGALTATKEAALIWATRNFDSLQWRGARTVVNQSHEFPRTGLFIDGGDYWYGADALYNTYMFDPATIPTFLADATAEAAMWLIAADPTKTSDTAGISALRVDTVELKLDKNDRPSWLNNSVKNIIWRYVINSNPYQATIVRV